MEQLNADALLATPTYRRARAAAVAAIAAGHRVVLLLSDHAAPGAGLLRAAIGDLEPAGRAVHVVAAPRLAAADLSHADRRVVVAIADAQDCEAVELRFLEEALGRAAGPQILLSATPDFRARTATAGCVTLHLAPFIVHLPPLPDADAAGFLQAITGRAGSRTTARRLRTAGGDPLAIERLARRTVPGAAAVAATPALAAILDRPRAGLAASLTLAAAAALALVLASPHPRPSANLPAPTPLPPVQPAPPPPAPADNAAPLVSGDLADEGAAASQSDTAVTVSRVDPDDVLSPRLVAARPGESLAALYRRAYRGLVAPPFAAIRSLNPAAIKAGALVICPAPAAGWPAPSR